MPNLKIKIIDIYLIKAFLKSLWIILFSITTLFIVFELFDKVRVILNEDANISLLFLYIFLKTPIVISMTLPLATLIATLTSIGRLSQLSEIIAMRAGGASIYTLLKPLLVVGLLISIINLFLNCYLVPKFNNELEDLYDNKIKKRAELGISSKHQVWFRDNEKFYYINIFDSKENTLNDLSIFEMDKNFSFSARTDSKKAIWTGSMSGWNIKNATRVDIRDDKKFATSNFQLLTLNVTKKPGDFYELSADTNSMTYRELKRYIKKMRKNKISSTKEEIQLYNKVTQSMLPFFIILGCFSFSLIASRSGKMFSTFVAGFSVGFAYYVLHGFSISLGNAELLPTLISSINGIVFLLLFSLYNLSNIE